MFFAFWPQMPNMYLTDICYRHPVLFAQRFIQLFQLFLTCIRLILRILSRVAFWELGGCLLTKMFPHLLRNPEVAGKEKGGLSDRPDVSKGDRTFERMT
jgi:hypothetical protein